MGRKFYAKPSCVWDVACHDYKIINKKLYTRSLARNNYGYHGDTLQYTTHTSKTMERVKGSQAQCTL